MHRTFLATLIVAAAVGASPAVAAGVSRCQGSGRPTSAAAWRAYVPARTPMRPRPGAAASGLTSRGRWLLVIGAASVPEGACLLEVRLERRPNTAHGWVAAARVRLEPTAWRIEVSRGGDPAV